MQNLDLPEHDRANLVQATRRDENAEAGIWTAIEAKGQCGAGDVSTDGAAQRGGATGISSAAGFVDRLADKREPRRVLSRGGKWENEDQDRSRQF